jgi:hypothetical protein
MSRKATHSIVIPDDADFDPRRWKEKYNDHFSTNEHVSTSRFAEFFGSRDLGLKLHIPPAGDQRNEMLAAEQKTAQKIRCSKLRNEMAPVASKNTDE